MIKIRSRKFNKGFLEMTEKDMFICILISIVGIILAIILTSVI